MKQPCIDCGTPADNTRCPTCTATHQRGRIRDTVGRAAKYGKGYRARAGRVRATALTCHICKQPARPGDPWQADHLIQGQSQGGGWDGPLAPAHRSCNIARANKSRSQTDRT